MVRRVVRIAIIGWLVGAGVQWARRTGAIAPRMKGLLRRGADRAATSRPASSSRRTDSEARAELAAVAAREASSTSKPSTASGQPAASTEAAASKAAAAPAGDDLKIIEGVGPRIDGVLREAGVSTFAELADLAVERIEEILRDAGVRASPSTWPEQARLAATGAWDALAELQARLKGGREVPTS